MKEGEIMGELGYHENIVNLQGVTASLRHEEELIFYLVMFSKA
jgi:hypothetical protein